MTNKVDITKSKLDDVVLGNKNVYPEVLHPLEKAIQAIKEKIKEDPALEGIIEELAEYTTDRPDRAWPSTDRPDHRRRTGLWFLTTQIASAPRAYPLPPPHHARRASGCSHRAVV